MQLPSLTIANFFRGALVLLKRSICFCLLMTLQLESGAAQSCSGYRTDFGRTRIIGGASAKLEHWPGQAALRLQAPASDRAYYFCGGTAIAPNWVLTAGHCVEAIKRTTDGVLASTEAGPLKGWKLQVVLGKGDLEDARATDVFQVAQIVVRDGYTTATKGKDLALVQLETKWNGPLARLALSSDAEPADNMAFVAGFGAIKVGQQPNFKKARSGEAIAAASPILQEVLVPVVPIDRCATTYHAKPKFRLSQIGEEQVCAGYDRERKDSCAGDSGGPLITYDNNNCPTQIGVVSWGDECAKPSAYGIYSRVAAHRDWILRHVPEAAATAAPMASKNLEGVISDRAIAAALEQLRLVLNTSHGRVDVKVSGAGEKVKLGGLFSLAVTSNIDGRLVLLDINSRGEVTQIFPNPYVISADARFIKAGLPVLIPDQTTSTYKGLKGFRAQEPLGVGRLIAIVAPKEASISEVVESPERVKRGLSAEPEPVPYVLNLFDQLIAAASAPGDWALGEMNYEIVR